jgi:predicted nuclease of restriction endonuclease-like (RecB) superfamily
VINQAKQSLAIAVNHTLVLSYWHIGKIINDSILQNKRATYGKAVVENLAKRLTLEYGDGFGKSNLTRMMSFNSKFADYQIVATLSQQFSWSHFVEFIKLEDDLKREFYITMCSNEKWSVRTLRERIASMLFERTAIAKKPDEVIKNDLALLIQEHKMTPELFLKDPYLLDFLNLPANFSEKDLEQAILLELEKFILEFGSDFAFIARQKRFQVGGDDFKLDLLFYHRIINAKTKIDALEATGQ